MAIIRMTAQEARDYVKKNDAKLQVMYDTDPFADEDPNSDVKENLFNQTIPLNTTYQRHIWFQPNN